MQTELKSIEQKTNSVNLKTINKYIFNLIQSAPHKVKFRDTIDVATIINDSHHIHGSRKQIIQQQEKSTAQPVSNMYPHIQWRTIGRGIDTMN